MKLKFIFLTLASAISSQAVTNINISNGTTTGPVWQILANDGTVVTGDNGSVLIGTFSSTDGLGSLPAAQVLGNFTQAASQPFSPVVDGVFGFAGGGGTSVELPNVGDEPGLFIGNPIFAVITDGSDFAVIDLGQDFLFEDATFNTGIDINPVIVNLGQDNIVRGIFDPVGRSEEDLPFANDGTATLSLGVIPEPSSALLAGLALVGGLVRRRR